MRIEELIGKNVVRSFLSYTISTHFIAPITIASKLRSLEH